MKAIIGLLLLISTGAAVASTPAADAMRSLQGSVAWFVGMAVAASLIGALVSRAMSKQKKSVRIATYRITVLAGVSLAALQYLGKLPF